MSESPVKPCVWCEGRPPSDAKPPLNVLVAQALGHVTAAHVGTDGNPHWTGNGLSIPAYDTDWSATGPLIEKYQLDLWFRPGGIFRDPDEWAATNDTRVGPDGGSLTGPTPLMAVCNLILALGEAGKL